MLPVFNSIHIFRDSIAQLCKKPKLNYYSCKKDICDFLNNKSFEDIWEIGYRIKDHENIRVIKIRLMNSAQNLSSSDGFRVIICCNKKYKTVTFLQVYPKRGKLQKMDQPLEEYKRQLRIYGSDFKENKLILHEINKDLEIIKLPLSS